MALLVPSTVSAHHTAAIRQSFTCRQVLTVEVDYVGFGDGHILHTEVAFDGQTKFRNATPTGDGTKTYTFPTFDGNGKVEATSWAMYPDGTPESDVVRSIARYSVDCGPSASFIGPCGDPMYQWSLAAGAYRTVFKVHVRMHDAGWKTFTRTVAAGKTFMSKPKHILGNTLMTITSNGKVLAHEQSAAPGTYKACPR